MTRIISPREDVKLLVVSVPEGSWSFELSPGRILRYWEKLHRATVTSCIVLPPGDYIPLGIAEELPDEVTRQLVDSYDYDEDADYKDYNDNSYDCDITPNESWHSFLRREGITERVYVLKIK